MFTKGIIEFKFIQDLRTFLNPVTMYITVVGFAISTLLPIYFFEFLYDTCCEYTFCQFVNLECNVHVRYLLFQESTVLHIGDKLRGSLYNYTGADFLNCLIHTNSIYSIMTISNVMRTNKTYFAWIEIYNG